MSVLASSTPASSRHDVATPNAASSTEFAFLLECCSLRYAEIVPCPEGNLNWTRAVELAEHHGVMPLLYRALSLHPGSVPAEVFEQLRTRYENTARKNLRFTAELFRILDCLQAHSIPAIPLKGPTLAETLYGDVALRDFSDLDVLIHPRDVERAKAALRTLDYSLPAPLSAAEERVYLAAGYEYTFDGPAGRNLLEVQWNTLPRFYSVAFDVDELFSRTASVTLCGRTVRALAPEDLLLTLTVHAAKHAWVRLHWLHDIAGVTQTQHLDWTVVAQRAHALGITRMVGVSLLLAHRLLQADLPAQGQALWNADPEILPLAQLVERELPSAEEYNVESTRYFRLMMRLRERPIDRARFLWRLVWTPGPGEWAIIRLPEPLFPFYRLIRLFRIAGKVLSGR